MYYHTIPTNIRDNTAIFETIFLLLSSQVLPYQFYGEMTRGLSQKNLRLKMNLQLRFF